MVYQPLGPPPHKSPYYVVNFDLRRQKGHGKKHFFCSFSVKDVPKFQKRPISSGLCPPRSNFYEVEAQGVDMP